MQSLKAQQLFFALLAAVSLMPAYTYYILGVCSLDFQLLSLVHFDLFRYNLAASNRVENRYDYEDHSRATSPILLLKWAQVLPRQMVAAISHSDRLNFTKIHAFDVRSDHFYSLDDAFSS